MVYASAFNHLNFGTIMILQEKTLPEGFTRVERFENDHLCSSLSIRKEQKAYPQNPKTENTNWEVLNTLHMDLCRPIRVLTINGKKYILVIVDDYSRFTCVKFLRSKDETSTVVIKFLKQIQVGLNKTVRFIRTDNDTESLIHTRHEKTPYELVHNKKPDLIFFQVFGALCYLKDLDQFAVPPPHPLIYNRPNKLDMSYSGLEEFQQSEFEGYGLRANKSICENSSNETKKIFDAPLIEEWVSDNEDEVESPVVVEKKTVVPTIPKVDVVRPKQQEKPVRKIVRYAEMYRSKGPRGNQRNWNNLKSQQLGSDFVMNNKACFVCESFDHLKKDCGKRIIKPVWKNTRRVM
ncbi:retrovirus-related pol polyprotein from transposon TNT 1-94 [Tanacetum coccineum]